MKNYTLSDYAEGLDLEVEKNSGNESSLTDITEADTKQSNSKTSRKAESHPVIPRKSTGPRTQRGKDKSKNNALKFGIFSRVAVLPGESQVEFDALLNGLRDHFQPIGTLEVTLAGC